MGAKYIFPSLVKARGHSTNNKLLVMKEYGLRTDSMDWA